MAIHDSTPVREMVLSVLVENRAGVLSHVVGLFSARGFNIDSLAVGETQDPTASRITLVTRGDARTLEQIKKQLNRLIDVIKIQDLSQDEYVDRELMLVKVRATPEARAALEPLMAKYRVHVADENDSVMTLECTESRENRKKLFEGLKAVGIIEMAQTGAVALGKKSPKSE